MTVAHKEGLLNCRKHFGVARLFHEQSSSTHENSDLSVEQTALSSVQRDARKFQRHPTTSSQHSLVDPKQPRLRLQELLVHEHPSKRQILSLVSALHACEEHKLSVRTHPGRLEHTSRSTPPQSVWGVVVFVAQVGVNNNDIVIENESECDPVTERLTVDVTLQVGPSMPGTQTHRQPDTSVPLTYAEWLWQCADDVQRIGAQLGYPV